MIYALRSGTGTAGKFRPFEIPSIQDHTQWSFQPSIIHTENST
jgi:hypothetical protein